MLAGKSNKILIDTGASKNCIKSFPELKGILNTETPFTVHSIHGKNQITKKCVINLFGNNTNCFILNNLSTFDAIIGFDFIKQIKPEIDLGKGEIKYNSGKEKL